MSLKSKDHPILVDYNLDQNLAWNWLFILD